MLCAWRRKATRALKELAGRFAQYLAGHPSASLPDVCHSANAGRAHFSHRLALTAESVAQAREALIGFADGRATAASSLVARCKAPMP